MSYQKRDWEVVNYQRYTLKNTHNITCRGPEPKSLKKNQYFVCVGAAQTYGCFCDRPYPILLQEKLNIPALNLGFSGAGPYFFLQQKQLLDYINQAKFAVIQVMSGRSESNSVFVSGGQEYLTRISDGFKIGANAAYQELLEKHDQNYVQKIIAETRCNWVDHFQQLLKNIKVPKVLFWFSTREPYYIEQYKNVHELFGAFPQLVNSKMVDQIKKYSDEYIECISSRGLPQLLISRFTHKPTNIKPTREDLRRLQGEKMFNNYYPSPEMHIDAAKALEKVCKKYLNIVTT